MSNESQQAYPVNHKRTSMTGEQACPVNDVQVQWNLYSNPLKRGHLCNKDTWLYHKQQLVY